MNKEMKSIANQINRLLQCGESDAAYEIIQSRLRADANNPSLLDMMGKILYHQQKYDEAYKYYKQAYYYDSTNPYAISGIILVSSEVEVDEPLEELFERIRERKFKECYFARTSYYLSDNNIKKAVREMREAYSEYPLDEEVIGEYISVLIKNNIDDEEIEKLIEKAKEISKSLAIFKTEIIYLYKACRYDECEKMSKRILRIYPNSDVAQTALELLCKIRDKRDLQEEIETFDNESRFFDETPPEAAEELLGNLIGLDAVKNEILRIKKKIEFDKARQETLGIALDNQDSYHFAFVGNPGTGKTTVARLLAGILHNAGFLEKGQLIEVERGDLVGEFQGHTAVKTKDVIKKALGGVLFIDEAYSLINGDNDDFGKEAIDTLVKEMEDHRKELVVILAGYKNEMYKLLQANVGLESRITKAIEFPDYSEDELLQIARNMATEQRYSFSTDGELAFKERINRLRVNSKFGNARAVRTLMNEAYMEKAIRFNPKQASVEYMTILTPEDFGIDLSESAEDKAKEILGELDKLVGLKDVKYEIKSNVRMMDYLKHERGEGNIDSIFVNNNMHLCFAGNPGTGKTTVARLYAEVMSAIGIAKTGVLIEASRGDFVGRYQGETAIKTKELCERSYGGILFIDEAYDLVHGENDSFGMEAVATLIKEMEDNRDRMIVVFAGYSKEMENFMNSNSGIKSRLAKTIVFPDYSLDELVHIFYGFADERNVIVQESAKDKINSQIERMYENRDSKFGNARAMRSFFERIWINMINRVEEEGLVGESRRTIIAKDISDNM